MCFISLDHFFTFIRSFKQENGVKCPTMLIASLDDGNHVLKSNNICLTNKVTPFTPFNALWSVAKPNVFAVFSDKWTERVRAHLR